jgi:hypothetical protein
MKRILVAVVGLSLLTAACSDPVAPPTPTPVPATIPESFSDTLLVLGVNMHTFTVNRRGALQVSLVSVTPAAAVRLGVGTPSGANCLVIDNLTTVAGPGVQLSGTATVPGNFCVSIVDVGNLVEPVTYTVNVLHS